MHLQKVIERLGYKSNEVKVYLAALRLGECTYSDLAVQLRLPRTSVQLMVDKLHKDGLMNFYVKRRYRYWIAESPEKFIIELREREAALRTVMPELSAMRKSGGGKPTVKTFIGVDEIRLVHEDILATQQPFVGIVPWDEWVSFLGQEYVNDFIERRIKRFLKVRLLFPKTSASTRLKDRDMKELRQARFLPDRFAIADAIFLYGNKVAIICLNKKQPTAVLIDDPSIRSTMTAFFEDLWAQNRV